MELKKEKDRINNKRYSLLIYLGIFLFSFGSFYLISYYYKNETKVNQELEMVDNYFKTIDEKKKNGESFNDESKENGIKKDEFLHENNYIAILEIPKINLKKGIYDKDNGNNNVEKNVYMLNETILPDENKTSHILLAAHSGNSYRAFFNNLKKLEMNDNVYFYYKGIKYIYEVVNKYEIKKTGKFELNQSNNSDITLISCISGTKKQIVYVAVLVEQERY